MRTSSLAPWAKRHAVVLVAFAAAAVSCVVVPPDGEYLEYFETRTLTVLFCAMAVIGALDNCGFISALAGRVIHHFHRRRSAILALVWVTALGAMVISNDMALLTFLPLTSIVLAATNNLRYLAFVFVLEAAAANLGGMITPFGSPQNLFLYSYFHIEPGEFFLVMSIPFAVSMFLLTALCFAIKDEPIGEVDLPRSVAAWPTLAYLALFVVAVAIVFRVLPIWAGLVVPAVLLVMDRAALVRLDYGLLLTFVLFFVLSGNLGRIGSVDTALTTVLEDNVLLWSAGMSQLISNVPAAILFAQFTDNYRELLVGVNIGGVGTIIASLASVIALAEYRSRRPGHTASFMVVFSAVNFGLLIVLVALMSAVFAAGVL